MDKETLHYLILALGSLIIAFIISLVLRKMINIYITRYAKKLNSDPTNFSFIKNSVGFIVYTAAISFIFIKVPFLKTLGSALFAGAGVLALVVGFASQKAFSNIISGIFILIFKPFRITDTIEFKDGQKGIIEEITLRHTIIKDYENRRIIIPNSIISEETIINSNINDARIKKHIIFSISYESDIDLAMQIIRDEIAKHPLTIDKRSEAEKQENKSTVLVRLINLGEYSVDLKAYVWANNNDDAFVLKCDVLKTIKQRFDREGIEIPYPHRTIVYKTDKQANHESAQ